MTKLTKVSLTFVPVEKRVPLKFGDQVLTEVSYARVYFSTFDVAQAPHVLLAAHVGTIMGS